MRAIPCLRRMQDAIPLRTEPCPDGRGDHSLHVSGALLRCRILDGSNCWRFAALGMRLGLPTGGAVLAAVHDWAEGGAGGRTRQDAWTVHLTERPLLWAPAHSSYLQVSGASQADVTLLKPCTGSYHCSTHAHAFPLVAASHAICQSTARRTSWLLVWRRPSRRAVEDLSGFSHRCASCISWAASETSDCL